MDQSSKERDVATSADPDGHFYLECNPRSAMLPSWPELRKPLFRAFCREEPRQGSCVTAFLRHADPLGYVLDMGARTLLTVH